MAGSNQSQLLLRTTNEEYDKLHRLADAGYPLLIKVEREAIQHLLFDHTKALQLLEEKGITALTPARERVKLKG